MTFALITLMENYSNTKPRERRFSLGVCTRTQRLIQSQDKSSVQPYQTADCMFAVMLPCFLFAMYEKHGQPLEVVVKNIIQTKFIAPKERPYRTDNFYSVLERQRKLEKEVSAIAKGNTKKQRGGKRKA